ncbi:MAG: hypothetical protein HKO12_02180 [Woeseiaceae bacterium]|nr:hypothetical protein [Woeseiaceae bacterium]
MNCLSGLRIRAFSAALLSLAVIVACGVELSESADSPIERTYDAHYRVTVDPGQSAVDVELEIRQPRQFLREMTFSSLPDTLGDFSGDGDVLIGDGKLQWLPPAGGGTLRWRAHVAHRRGNKSYDAWLGPDWGMFRAEDIIPRARTRTLKGATSNTTLSFVLPRSWSVVTEYAGTDDPIRIHRADRRFDQPTGWMLVGGVGVRRETIAGVRVAVAGPMGHAVRRMDMLALLNWTLPELVALLPDPPTRLTIVSAGDPMWRGGLSAPSSLYIHADRPLISENATSTLLHEVVHSAASIKSRPGADWIVEGLAEFYSISLLERGGAISARRYQVAVSQQAEWAGKASFLCGPNSTGANTALAVTVLHALNKEIEEKTGGANNLDDLFRQVIASESAIGVAELRDIATKIIGQPSDALHSDNLPGCSRIAPGEESS